MYDGHETISLDTEYGIVPKSVDELVDLLDIGAGYGGESATDCGLFDKTHAFPGVQRFTTPGPEEKWPIWQR